MSAAPQPIAKQRLALLALVSGAVAIAFSPVFVRLSELGPTATGFHRAALSLAPLFFAMLWFERRAGRPYVLGKAGDDLRLMALPGALFAGDLFFWHLAIGYTTVANATLLSNFAPIIVTIGAWWLLKERISGGFVMGMLLAIVGVGLLVGVSFTLGERFVIGDGLGGITALFYGGYMLAIAWCRNRIDTVRVMFWSSLVTAALLLPIALWLDGSLAPASLRGWLVLIGLAWGSHALGQGLIAYGLGHLPASLSSIVVLVQPVTAAILGSVILGEALVAQQIAGGVVVLAGIYIARRYSGVKRDD